MIITLLSWVIIFFFSAILGKALIAFFAPNAYKKTTRVDVYVFCGLMILNVYAQVFSIFSKVGRDAFLVLAGITVLAGILIIYKGKKDTVNQFQIKECLTRIKLWQWCVMIGVVLYIGFWTMISPTHCDTYGYHAQAIRWIEEYGVVPGLGNLHNRFAYNSAFMALQALFSFSWTYQQSLHSMNGFACVILLIYAIITNKVISKEARLSDFLKIAAPIYIYLSRRTISSSGSDNLAMVLILYIAMKWSECIEREEEDEQTWGILCLIAVYAATVKLSAVTSVILVIHPAILLIKNKKVKTIVKDILFGFIIILPWMIRSVLISGYLVYPYSFLDLFNVDWKMPKDLLDYDKKEIIVWGRGVRDVSKYDESIFQWFGTWFNDQMSIYKIVIIFGFLALILLALFFLVNMICKWKGIKIPQVFEQKTELLLVFTCIAGLAFWLFSAPLVRYGVVYLLMPICIVAYIVRVCLGHKWFNNLVAIGGVLLIGGFYLVTNDDFRLLHPQDYWRLDNVKVQWHGFEVYVSGGNISTGYHDFPAMPKEEVLEENEPRGDRIEDGFRRKK